MASLPLGGAGRDRSPSLISATNIHLFSLIPIVVRLKTKRKIAKAKKNIYKGSLLAMSKAFFDCTEPLIWLHWTFCSAKAYHSFDCTEPFARWKPTTPLIILDFSFAFTEMPSPQRNYSEPSLSKRRALAETITSPRQLVKSKGTFQSTPKCASVNPL